MSIKRSTLIIASLLFLTVLAYANSLHGAFVFDDLQIVLTNPAFSHIHTLHDVFAMTSANRGLLFLTYGLNFYFGGLRPEGYHAVNIFLHMINVVLVYFIVRKLAWPEYEMYSTEWEVSYAGFAGASVFAVHTLLSGGVSYISGRSSILCAVFYFASILFFLKGRWWVLGSAACAVLAWECKQEAIALPIFLGGLVILRERQKDWRIIGALMAIPLLCVVFFRLQLKALFVSVVSNTNLVSAGFETVMAPGQYFRTYVTAIVGYYFPRMIFPISLSVDPYIPRVAHWYSAEFVVSILVLAGIAMAFVRYAKDEPLLGAGIAALLLSPLTVYAIAPMADPVFEYRAYIPMLGIALLAGWLFPKLNKYSLLCVVAALLVGTAYRNLAWTDSVTVWEDAAVKSPEKARAHFNLGTAYQETGRQGEAISEYRRALDLKPDIWAAYSNMGSLEMETGHVPEAEADLIKATTYATNFPEGFINLGVLYLRQNQPYRGMAFLDRALSIDPGNFSAHFNKAEALMQMKSYQAAIAEYKTAIYLRPEVARTRIALAFAYSQSGDRESYEKQIAGLKSLGIMK